MQTYPTENQKRVINKTCEKLRTGKLINKGKILKEIGYSKRTSEHPKYVYDSKGVQEGLKPIADRLKAEIDRIQAEMESRDLTKEQYKELSDVQDKKIKNYQLLTGNPTESFSFNIDPEKLKKINEIMDK